MTSLWDIAIWIAVAVGLAQLVTILFVAWRISR